MGISEAVASRAFPFSQTPKSKYQYVFNADRRPPEPYRIVEVMTEKSQEFQSIAHEGLLEESS
eukprot:5093723-Ditylum_brightwellii.AAC.1